MALNAKWGELFGDDSPGARMTLASTDGPPGAGNTGGGPDLEVSEGPWTTAAGVANALNTSSASALTELDTASEGIAGGAAGFTSTPALEEVRTSWKGRLASVRDECLRLEGALKSAGKEFGEQEIRNKKRFEGQASK
ncbi:hypothetical protein NLX86_23875 [Streptomyces sp. A3M-1-3]|uniref:hypothetical protein n=1 Tax=Streptomyces sp. A3M-1-3 TaxID=2962044 RepID=UPI0020B79FEE|nr:hypothetical protein [Streptomyces sp. A3M-1-3]MCP3821020.1 hypothetical protein [Streptomyces sp. A3M-1-3]